MSLQGHTLNGLEHTSTDTIRQTCSDRIPHGHYIRRCLRLSGTRETRELLYRNPSRHLPESFAVRLGAGTPAYGCSFPGRVDTIEALLRLLLRLRTIRDLHKELKRAQDDRLRPLHQRARRWTIDYDQYIDALFVGPGCSNSSSAALRV